MRMMLQEFWEEEEGMGTVEMVLILAALVCVALMFRDRIEKFVTTALNNIFSEGNQNKTKTE